MSAFQGPQGFLRISRVIPYLVLCRPYNVFVAKKYWSHLNKAWWPSYIARRLRKKRCWKENRNTNEGLRKTSDNIPASLGSEFSTNKVVWRPQTVMKQSLHILSSKERKGSWSTIQLFPRTDYWVSMVKCKMEVVRWALPREKESTRPFSE